ncbi:MAG: 3-dehydroquinate synthase family protein [Saprospiraceae bacterium]
MSGTPFTDSLIFFQQPWERLSSILSRTPYSGTLIVCDANTRQHCLPYMLGQLNLENPLIFELPVGEQTKSLAECERFWNFALENGVGRKTICLAVGGGVVTDFTGFCTSVLLRGIDCIYIPTSLMGMADAALGGKTGINFMQFKNQIGLFKLPKAILIEPAFLKTLSESELKNGYVEIIKHSLIQDPPFWEELRQRPGLPEMELLPELIRKSVRFKMEIVQKDFHETGLRQILNFGHSFGHAIEGMLLNSPHEMLHGQAVAYGIIYESWLSSQKFAWRAQWFPQIKEMMLPFLGAWRPQAADFPGILKWMSADKKNLQGKIRMTLLERPGQPKYGVEVDAELVNKTLEDCNF